MTYRKELPGKPLQSIRMLPDGRVLSLVLGNLPSLEWVESHKDSVPVWLLEDYLALHRERCQLEAGLPVDAKDWQERWSTFATLMQAFSGEKIIRTFCENGHITYAEED